MPRTFAYVRASTPGQTTDNQLQEIQAAGFGTEPHPVVTESVSGSAATVQRRGFARLLDRLEAGDVLVVSKLDQQADDERDQRGGGVRARPADRAHHHAAIRLRISRPAWRPEGRG